MFLRVFSVSDDDEQTNCVYNIPRTARGSTATQRMKRAREYNALIVSVRLCDKSLLRARCTRTFALIIYFTHSLCYAYFVNLSLFFSTN